LRGRLGAKGAIATRKLHVKGNLANVLRYNDAINRFIELMQGMDMAFEGDAAKKEGVFMEPINVSDYEALARASMEPATWDFYAGGSDDEVTLRANRTAFERIRLRPRMLVDVTVCDLRTTVLGTPVSIPILIAPTAYHGLAYPAAAECATAQAAGEVGTLMVASTVSNRRLEEIAAAASGPLWFQLYTYGGYQVCEELVRRAQAAGYRAIVLTVDLARLGRREKDLRNHFALPSHLREGNFTVNTKLSEKGSLLTWEVLPWLRSLTTLPILLKGILTAEDAELAVQQGVEGIIVSNHGGRQLDSALASIEALPEVVEAVAGRCEVYMDGGIRRGTDVLKALALGARAVLVGRPILWGLAVNGAAGARHILELLRNELELAMALSGRPTIASIDRSLVRLL
jgi:4-hydroxymandelate oxidase